MALSNLSEPPNSSPVAILGISARTIDELDANGITLDTIGDDFMTFNWTAEISQRQSEFLKGVIKKKVGHQCRISYVPPTGRPEILILKRKYLT